MLLLAALAAGGCASHTPARTPSSEPSQSVRELRAALARVFGARTSERGVWGVDIRSLDTGEHLYELNAGKLMMPASNMKIVTLAATAEALGWDYRFTTTLETRGAVSAGVLHGDLVIRGNGDPTINSRQGRAEAVIGDWASALHAAGISTIDGRIVGNDQAFDDEGLGAGWSWDYLQYGYAAPVGALEFNESVAALVVSPAPAAGATPTVTLSPGSGLELVNHAITGAPGSPDTIDYRRHLDRPVLEVTGSIPAAAQARTRNVAVVNPTLFFAESVKIGLQSRGIVVTGPAVDFDDIAAEMPSGEPRILVTTLSPPLATIAAVLMKVSQNLYAETLLKALGASANGLGTFPGGLLKLRSTLESWGVPGDAHIVYDGSGLSRYNYVTAATVATVLEHMYKDPRHHDPFIATLPVAGKEGTLEERMRHTPAQGNAVAKTGSIANVRALSGFVKSRDGEMIVFSIIANDFVIPSATITWMADLGVEILSNFSRKVCTPVRYNTNVLRIAALVLLVACGVGAGVWYYRTERAHPAVKEEPADTTAWLDQLYSSNPADAEKAARQVQALGADALPAIHATFQDPSATPERVKAALKACGILGPAAASAVAEVAEQLPDPTVTAEAAIALSFMGRTAFAPLRDALRSDDPVVRREALRSIGKLKERAPLDARAVLPLLIGATADPDPGVRTVAATYLGIIHEGGTEAVRALIDALKDPEPDVRRAAASALGSFGAEAAPAVPALRKAAGDADPDVAREAAVTLVKLQPQK